MPISNELRLAKFWGKVRKGSGCWEWTGYLMNQGYGELIWFMHKALAHRVSWTIANGTIPDGLFVCHRCDNRKCVRPDHLFLGSKSDNTNDMWSKKRGVKPPKMAGVRNNKAKLTEQQVKEIRQSTEKGKELARRFGVSYNSIWRARTGRNWQHI